MRGDGIEQAVPSPIIGMTEVLIHSPVPAPPVVTVKFMRLKGRGREDSDRKKENMHSILQNGKWYVNKLMTKAYEITTVSYSFRKNISINWVTRKQFYIEF